MTKNKAKGSKKNEKDIRITRWAVRKLLPQIRSPEAKKQEKRKERKETKMKKISVLLGELYESYSHR